ncbi:MAG TPA: hypothetical protein VLC92_21410 [Rhodocyclaceae bacterium]|nr:hypothetical protein [Rhodocyclaceae bacterium]
MQTPLVPQEIYLLERYCSLERLEKLRDTWRAMLDHAEDMMARYMQRLPHDLRNRPSYEQPDFVWGGRVLPNFRDTANALEDACVKRAGGDYEALARAVGVTGDVRGFNDGYSSDWMDEVQPGAVVKFDTLFIEASRLAWPIDITTGGTWGPGELTVEYDKIVKEPLSPPSSWPIYRLNQKVQMRSGDRTPQSGIYLPDIDGGFPTLHVKHERKVRGEANEAKIANGYLPCTWTLVERVADSGGEVPGQEAWRQIEAGYLRSAAGEPCPQAGFWFTPAKVNSRRHFKQGDVMPDMDSLYGATIWQWDEQQ